MAERALLLGRCFPLAAACLLTLSSAAALTLTPRSALASQAALAAQGGAPNRPSATAATPSAATPTPSAAAPSANVPSTASGQQSPQQLSAHQPSPHQPSPQQGQQALKLMTGDPLASDTHRQQGEFARSERSFQAQNISRPEQGMLAGTIGVLIRDAQGQPLAGRKVILERVRESIAEGNKTDELSQISTKDGHAGFRDLSTNTDYLYSIVTHEGPAKYTSGQFRLDRQHGQLVVLTVYPVTSDINQTFIGSRVLYVIEPRDDVFQVQALFRFHNTNPMTWVPEDFRIRLPVGSKAFRPSNKTGDLQLLEEDGAVLIKGTFSPGEHELSFAFQLDNPADATARLVLPLSPHAMDAKVHVEASPNMGITSPSLDSAGETRGKQGQRALTLMRDFLRSDQPRPAELPVTITGLPTRGSGALVASLIALAIATMGAVAAFGNRRTAIAASDKQQARELLMQELVAVEKAYRSEVIGPKTYEQTRRSLLDALVRIEAAQN